MSNCAPGTDLIYALGYMGDTNIRLLTFDPAVKTFKDLGPISCQSADGSLPFSIAVDRMGTLWVLYFSRELFTIPLSNPTECVKTTWNPPSGLQTMSLSFVSDPPGSNAESMYVIGGTTIDSTTLTMARIDPATFHYTAIGPTPLFPALAGSSDGELWGFRDFTTTATMVQFDKSTGAELGTYSLPTLARDNNGWTFAQWGGDFWVFFQQTTQPAATYQVGRDGMVKSIVEWSTAETGKVFTATSSTCAPVETSTSMR